MLRRSKELILAMGLAGCTSGPSHIPPLWQLPGAAVSSVVGNAVYDARRNAVKQRITLDERALVADIDFGGGAALNLAMDTARIAPDRRASVIAELRGEPEIYRRADDRTRLDIEAVTVVLMVYGR